METAVLFIVYGVVAWFIAKKAKQMGFSWAKYFWINLLLGIIGWAVTFFLWRADSRKTRSPEIPTAGKSSGVTFLPQPPELPPNSLRVSGSGYFGYDIVGESFHLPAIHGIAKTRGGVGQHTVDAVVKAEPSNKADPKAIRVEIDGNLVGYVAREKTSLFRPLLARVAQNGKTLVLAAELYYGKDYDDEFVGSVRLDVPDDLALVVPANQVPPGAALWPKGAKVQVTVNPEATSDVMSVLSNAYQDQKVAVHCELRAAQDEKAATGVEVLINSALVGSLSPVSAKKFAPVLGRMGPKSPCYFWGVAAGNSLAVDLHLRMKKPEELSADEIGALRLEI
jgi:hypothetical protein